MSTYNTALRFGKAAEIATALGRAKRVGQEWRCLCPAHEDHEPSLDLRETPDGRILWCCRAGCPQYAVAAELIRRGLIASDRRPRVVPPPAPVPDRSTLDWLLSRLRPIEGTVVETYLRVRGLDPPPPGHHLRFLPANPPEHPWPAMVGIISAFRDARCIQSLHFTRLRPDGSGRLDRSYLAGCPKKGGVIRLSDDTEVTLALGLAEGIETALAVRTAFWRDEARHVSVWSALDAGNLAELPVVPGIETLTIYADAGPAGENAAIALGERWDEAGREVWLSTPEDDDWNPAAVAS